MPSAFRIFLGSVPIPLDMDFGAKARLSDWHKNIHTLFSCSLFPLNVSLKLGFFARWKIPEYRISSFSKYADETAEAAELQVFDTLNPPTLNASVLVYSTA